MRKIAKGWGPVWGPDIVYPVRKGDWNEELRYSLRSLSLFPHNRIFLVGHKPPWVTGVAHIPRPQTGSKYRNATEGLVEVTHELGASLSRPFYLWNDDFYVLQPMEQIPVYHLGPLEDRVLLYRKLHHGGAYWRGMRDTLDLLLELGIPDPLSYEGHRPLPIYREPLLEAWAKGKGVEVLHIRTLYGNLANLGGTYLEDSKVHRGKPLGWEQWPFLSTNDDINLSPVGAYLRERFPSPSPYELDQ